MQAWVNFWTFFFWLTLFLFFLNSVNFIALLFYSELVWITLYCFSVLLSGINDDILLLCMTFFLLALAGLEFSLGFLLIIAFKSNNKTIDFESKKKEPMSFWMDNHNKLYANRLKKKSNFKFKVLKPETEDPRFSQKGENRIWRYTPKPESKKSSRSAPKKN